MNMTSTFGRGDSSLLSQNASLHHTDDENYLTRMDQLETHIRDVLSCTARITEKLAEVDQIPLQIDVDDMYSSSIPNTPGYAVQRKGLATEYLVQLNIELNEASLHRAQTAQLELLRERAASRYQPLSSLIIDSDNDTDEVNSYAYETLTSSFRLRSREKTVPVAPVVVVETPPAGQHTHTLTLTTALITIEDGTLNIPVEEPIVVEEPEALKIDRERKLLIEQNSDIANELLSKCAILKARIDRQQIQNESYQKEINDFQSSLEPKLLAARQKVRKSKISRSEVEMKLKLLELVAKVQNLTIPELVKKPEEEQKVEEDKFLGEAAARYNIRPKSYSSHHRASNAVHTLDNLPEESKKFLMNMPDLYPVVENPVRSKGTTSKELADVLNLAAEAILQLNGHEILQQMSQQSVAAMSQYRGLDSGAVAKAQIKALLGIFHGQETDNNNNNNSSNNSNSNSGNHSNHQQPLIIFPELKSISLQLSPSLLQIVAHKLAVLRQSLERQDVVRAVASTANLGKIKTIDSVTKLLQSAAGAISEYRRREAERIKAEDEARSLKQQASTKAIKPLLLGRTSQINRQQASKIREFQKGFEAVRPFVPIDVHATIDEDAFNDAMEVVSDVDCNLMGLLKGITLCPNLTIPVKKEIEAAPATSAGKSKSRASKVNINVKEKQQVEMPIDPKVAPPTIPQVFPSRLHLTLTIQPVQSALCAGAYSSYVKPYVKSSRPPVMTPAPEDNKSRSQPRASMTTTAKNKRTSMVSKKNKVPPSISSQEGNLLFDLRESCDVLTHVRINLAQSHCISHLYEKELKQKIDHVAREVRIPTSSIVEANATIKLVKDLAVDVIQHLITTTPQVIFVKDRGSLFASVLRSIMALCSVVFHCTDPQLQSTAAVPQGVTKATLEARMLQIIALTTGYYEGSATPEDEGTDDDLDGEDKAVVPETRDEPVDPQVTSNTMNFQLKSMASTTGGKSLPFWLRISELSGRSLEDDNKDPKATYLPIYREPAPWIEELGQCLQQLCQTDSQCMNKYKYIAVEVHRLILGMPLSSKDGRNVSTPGKSSQSQDHAVDDNSIFPLIPDAHRDDPVFTPRHHHAVLALELFLYAVTNVHDFSHEMLNKKLEQGIDQCEMFITSSIVQRRTNKTSHKDHQYYSELVIPTHDVRQILATCLPEVVPGILALDIFRRVILEEFSRRHLLQRLVAGDDDLHDLQFLNPTLPTHMDVFVAKIKYDLMKLSDVKKSVTTEDPHDNEERDIGSIHSRWQNDMCQLVISQCSLLEHMLWGHVKKPAHRLGDNLPAQHKYDTWDSTEYLDGDMTVPVIPLPDDLKSRLWYHGKQLREVALARRNNISKILIDELEPSFRQFLSDIVVVRKRVWEVVTAFSMPWQARLAWLTEQHAFMLTELLELGKREAELDTQLAESEEKLREINGLVAEAKGKGNKKGSPPFVVTHELEQRLFGEDMVLLDQRINALKIELENASSLYNKRKREYVSMVSTEVIHEGTNQILEWRRKEYLMDAGLIPREEIVRVKYVPVIDDPYDQDSDFDESDLHGSFHPRDLTIDDSLSDDRSRLDLGSMGVPDGDDGEDDDEEDEFDENGIKINKRKKPNFKTVQTAVIIANQFLNASKEVYEKRKMSGDVLQKSSSFKLPKHPTPIIKPPIDVVSEEELSTWIDEVIDDSPEIEQLLPVAAPLTDELPAPEVPLPNVQPPVTADYQSKDPAISDAVMKRLLDKLDKVRVSMRTLDRKTLKPFRERSGTLNLEKEKLEDDTRPSALVDLKHMGGTDLILSQTDVYANPTPRSTALQRLESGTVHSTFQRNLSGLPREQSFKKKDSFQRELSALSRDPSFKKSDSFVSNDKKVSPTVIASNDDDRQVQPSRDLTVIVDDTEFDDNSVTSGHLQPRRPPRLPSASAEELFNSLPTGPPIGRLSPTQRESIKKMMHDAFRTEFPKLPDQLPYHFVVNMPTQQATTIQHDISPDVHAIQRSKSFTTPSPSLLVSAIPIHGSTKNMTTDNVAASSRVGTAEGISRALLSNIISSDMAATPDSPRRLTSSTHRELSSKLKKDKARRLVEPPSNRIPYREVIQMVAVKRISSRHDVYVEYHNEDVEALQRVMTPMSSSEVAASSTVSSTAPNEHSMNGHGGNQTRTNDISSVGSQFQEVNRSVRSVSFDDDNVSDNGDDADRTHADLENYGESGELNTMSSSVLQDSEPLAEPSTPKPDLLLAASIRSSSKKGGTGNPSPAPPLSTASLSGYIQLLRQATITNSDSPVIGTKTHASIFSPEVISSSFKQKAPYGGTSTRAKLGVLDLSPLSPASPKPKPRSAGSSGSGTGIKPGSNTGKGVLRGPFGSLNSAKLLSTTDSGIVTPTDGTDSSTNLNILNLLANNDSLFADNTTLPTIKSAVTVANLQPQQTAPPRSGSNRPESSGDTGTLTAPAVTVLPPKSPKPPVHLQASPRKVFISVVAPHSTTQDANTPSADSR